MNIRRSSTLLLVPLCRSTGRPTGLRCLAPDSIPFNAHRYLTSDGPSESTSSKSSPSTGPKAQGEVTTSTYKPYYSKRDPSLPIVEYQTWQGSAQRNVKVSAKTDAATLASALSPLLTAHMSRTKDTHSIGSKGWNLDVDGARIIRFFAFNSEADVAKFTESVRTAADEMDHHPEIASLPDRRTNSTLRYVVISCNTHRPPGLSMRDVALAKKIDELAETFDYMAKDTGMATSAFVAVRRDLVRELRRPKGENKSNPTTNVRPYIIKRLEGL